MHKKKWRQDWDTDMLYRRTDNVTLIHHNMSVADLGIWKGGFQVGAGAARAENFVWPRLHLVRPHLF